MRAFFLKTSPALRLPETRIRIVGFRSEREYRPFRPREAAPAFYATGAGHDTIVLQSLDRTYQSSAVHEFVRLLLSVAEAKAPLWLNEGLAQLYETLTPLAHGAVKVGDVPPGRLDVLSQKNWLGLEALFALDHGSAYYRDPKLVPLFYSESWALTHMLVLSDKYRPKGMQFLDAVFGGQEAAEAIRAVHGQSLAQVRQDLDAYARNLAFRALVFPYGVEKPAEQPEIRPATALESGMVQADVLAAQAEKRTDARLAYEKLAATFPQGWQPAAGLAFVALAAGERDAALRHFARADELGCDDPRVYLDYGRLAVGPGDAGLPAKLLRKALDLKPGTQEMLYQLSLGLYSVREYRAAWTAMQQLKSVTPEQAPGFFLALAYCSHSLGYDAMAKDAARMALGAARTDYEKNSANAMLESLSRPATGQQSRRAEIISLREASATGGGQEDKGQAQLVPRAPVRVEEYGTDTLRRAEGVLVQVDCLGEGARVWIQGGERKLGFVISKAGQVIILRGGETIVHEFECGPQKSQPKVAIRYESKPDAGQGVQGVVKTLEFQWERGWTADRGRGGV